MFKNGIFDPAITVAAQPRRILFGRDPGWRLSAGRLSYTDFGTPI